MKAHEIKAIRERAMLSRAEFARLLGVTYHTVAKWERGEATPAPYLEPALITLIPGPLYSSMVNATIRSIDNPEKFATHRGTSAHNAILGGIRKLSRNAVRRWPALIKAEPLEPFVWKVYSGKVDANRMVTMGPAYIVTLEYRDWRRAQQRDWYGRFKDSPQV